MGKATIVSGGDKGLYRVTVDYDRDYIDTRLEWIDDEIDDLVSERDIAAAAVLTAQDAFDVAASDLADAITAMNAANAAATDKITDPTVIRTTEETKTITKAYATAANDLTKTSSKLADIKMRLEALGAERLLLLDVPQDYETEIWCADFVENLAEGAVVATIETPNNGLNIDVSYTDQAAFTQASDGQVTPAAEQSPAAVYYNLAMKGPWEKWRAKFRVGTITKIYLDENTGDPVADILLDEAYATEIKQIGGGRIDINQTPDLIAVPFEYMDCDFRAFAIEDRVIIGFTYQAWNAPKVIGFETNPRPCPAWVEEFNGTIYFMGKNKAADFDPSWIAPGGTATPVYNQMTSEPGYFEALYGPQMRDYEAAPGWDLWDSMSIRAYMTEDHHKLIISNNPFVSLQGAESYALIRSTPEEPTYDPVVGWAITSGLLTLLPGDCEDIVLPDSSPSRDTLIPDDWETLEIIADVGQVYGLRNGQYWTGQLPGVGIILQWDFLTLDWMMGGWSVYGISGPNATNTNFYAQYVGVMGCDIPDNVRPELYPGPWATDRDPQETPDISHHPYYGGGYTSAFRYVPFTGSERWAGYKDWSVAFEAVTVGTKEPLGDCTIFWNKSIVPDPYYEQPDPSSGAILRGWTVPDSHIHILIPREIFGIYQRVRAITFDCPSYCWAKIHRIAFYTQRIAEL